MRLTHRRHLQICIIAASLGLASLAAVGPARAQTAISEGIVSPGALEWPEYVAASFGWFKDNGVDLDLVTVGATAATQVAAGSINLGYSGFPDFVRAANQGAPVKIILNCVGEPPYAIFAKPAIKKVADLKGKTMSIGGAKDVTLIYTRPFLEAAGLKTSDVDFIYAKATPDRFAALVGGGADAAILYPPFTSRAAAAGYTNLGDVQATLPGFPFTVMAVNTAWAAAHRPAIEGYVKAYARAVNWLYDPQNKAKALDILVQYSRSDRGDASDTYDYFIGKIHAFSRTGLVDESVYRKMSDALVDFGDLTAPVPPIAKFFDTSYVQAAWK